MTALSEAVRDAVEQALANPASLTAKNRAAVPTGSLVLLADASGVCFLDPSGALRAVQHDGCAVDVPPWAVRAAQQHLAAQQPELYASMRDAAAAPTIGETSAESIQS